MSICCCDWQYFSQIHPAQPVGSQESGEISKEGDLHIHSGGQKEDNCSVSM